PTPPPPRTRGRMPAEAPARSVPCSPTPRPWTWKSGRASSSRSGAVQRHATAIAADVASRLAWLAGTPLGGPEGGGGGAGADHQPRRLPRSVHIEGRRRPARQVDADAGGRHTGEASGVVQHR